jgi:hypothetical protein
MRGPWHQRSQRRLGVAGNQHRTFVTELLSGEHRLGWNTVIHKSVLPRMLAEMRLDLIASNTAHRPDRTASSRAQNVSR